METLTTDVASEARRSGGDGEDDVEDRFGSGLEGEGEEEEEMSTLVGHNLGPLPDTANNNVDKGA